MSADTDPTRTEDDSTPSTTGGADATGDGSRGQWRGVPSGPDGSTVPVRWSDLHAMRSRIDDLEGEVDGLETRVGALEGEVAFLEDELERVRAERDTALEGHGRDDHVGTLQRLRRTIGRIAP